MVKNEFVLLGFNQEQLKELVNGEVKKVIKDLEKSLGNLHANDELLTREEACKLLKIDLSTLWHWTNKGKVKAYAIASRRYYKRCELLEALKPLKK